MAETANYIAVDSIPELAEERRYVRDEAWTLVHEREALVAIGRGHEIPMSLDALSTADRVLEAKNIYGPGSEEYDERLEGLRLDCRRLVGEWFRKNKPEYFAPVRHAYDETSGAYYSHGMSIRQMTEAALRPIAGSLEETARRVNERVEDETPRIVRKLGSFAMQQMGIRTFSECTDQAITDYQQDKMAGRKHRGYDGYVPEIQKIMIRDMRIDPETGDRMQEQLGLPGIYINDWILREALQRRGIDAKNLTKTELHGTQVLANDDLMDFVRQLDEIASEEFLTNIFMGEEVPDGYRKDYDNFRAEALARQESLESTTNTVATFVLNLAEDGFDRRKAPAHVEEFVKKLLLNLAQKDLSLAEQMFDKQTAAGLYEVGQLYAMGRNREAFELLQEVEKQAPGGGFCSGGSCGLESVDRLSGEGLSLKRKLKAEDSDTIVRDKERKCKCGAKGIVYSYNANKVNKYCTGCHAFETKQTTGGKK